MNIFRISMPQILYAYLCTKLFDVFLKFKFSGPPIFYLATPIVWLSVKPALHTSNPYFLL